MALPSRDCLGMDIHRQCLGWDKPFTMAVAERLSLEEPGGQLDGTMVWVPSARAGRHILSELFSGAEDGNEAFHPPRLLTPVQFEQALQPVGTLASESLQFLAWKTVVYRASPSQLAALFPVVPEQGRHQWAFSVAEQLKRLRLRLAEDGEDFRSIHAAGPDQDRDRWGVLAHLESAYLEALRGDGLSDPEECFEGRLEASLPLLEYKRLVIAGILNLSKLQEAAARFLQRRGIAIELYLPIPDEELGHFDDWGRPNPDYWQSAPLPPGLVHGAVQRTGDPRDLVDETLALADVYQQQVDALVLGAPDAELTRYTVERSRLTATPMYTPEGKALSATAWGRLLGLLPRGGGDIRLRSLLELLRHALFRKWISNQGCSVAEVERALIKLLKEQMLESVSQLRDPALKPMKAAGVVRDFLKEAEAVLRPKPADARFPDWLWGILQTVSSGIELSEEAGAVLGALEEILQDLQSELDPGRVREEDYWSLLGYLMENRHHYPEREASERPVSGWLELPWERAPHLVVLGLPDRKVPGSDGTDAFLTPRLCEQLKLVGPPENAAFHAFRLRLLLESRKTWGKLDILLPDRGLDDDPELPCRFLFLADESDILERVDLLMSSRSSTETALPAEFGAQLAMPGCPPVERISVTDFRAYLTSPLHYLLERKLRWAAPRELPLELDPMAFGTLAHTVLEQLSATEEGAALSNEKDIRGYLEAALSKVAGEEFGSQPSVPVLIQVNGLRERLHAAASLIAAERRAGWRPVRSEWHFRDDIALSIENVLVSGTIDLVERNEENGRYRIIDYKTSEKAVEAKAAHLTRTNANSAEALFTGTDFEEGGSTWRWKDLQLILYSEAVRIAYGELAEVAYLNLAKARKEIRLSTWTPTEVQSRAGLDCAAAIIRQIREGRFPLGRSARYRDDWLPWFGGDYATGIAPAWRERHMEVEA